MKVIKKQNKHSLYKIIAIIVGLIILIGAGYAISTPLLDNADRNRFNRLDDSMKSVFVDLKNTEESTGTWTYSKSCTEKLAGDWPTGEFTCETSVTLETTVDSAASVNRLHQLYYPVIDSSDNLRQLSALSQKPGSKFGKEFVVSSAEKHFTENTTGIECRYLANLEQNSDNETPSNFLPGSLLKDQVGIVEIKLTCRDNARSDWYSN